MAPWSLRVSALARETGCLHTGDQVHDLLVANRGDLALAESREVLEGIAPLLAERVKELRSAALTEDAGR